MPSQPFRPRILRATAATLSWQGLDQYGEPADPGTVTIGVVNSAGTTVVASGTATTGSGSTERTYSLTASQTATCDVLTATWTVSGVAVAATEHDIVGGFLFSLADVRGVEKSTSDQTKDPASAARFAREVTEWQIEDYCGQAFVPRFTSERRANGASSRRFQLTYPNLRVVRWAKHWQSGTATSLTAAECAEIPANSLGFAERPSSSWWANADVEIGYEHGMIRPPRDLERAAMRLFRLNLDMHRSQIPDRATAWTDPNGSNFTLGRVGTERRPTGIDEVDEVLRRYDATVQF